MPDAASLFGRGRLAANDRLVADFIAGARGERRPRASTGTASPVGSASCSPRTSRPSSCGRGTYSRKATLDETAIEAPFRLQVSPTSEGHWVHAAHPVPADDAPGHVELWHTRLDTGARTEEDLLRPTEPRGRRDPRHPRRVGPRPRRPVDRRVAGPDVDQSPNQLSPDEVKTTGADADPFLGSLDRADRHRSSARRPRSGPARAPHASSRRRSGPSGSG